MVARNTVEILPIAKIAKAFRSWSLQCHVQFTGVISRPYLRVHCKNRKFQHQQVRVLGYCGFDPMIEKKASKDFQKYRLIRRLILCGLCILAQVQQFFCVRDCLDCLSK